MNKDIYTEGIRRIKIPELEITAERFIKKTVVLYGKTGSGKTAVVKNIAYALKDSIDQAVVVSRTEVANGTYGEFINPTLIHNKIWLPNPENPNAKEAPIKGGLRFLETIHERQKILVAIFKKVSDITTLKSLFSKIKNKKMQQHIDNINIAKIRALQQIAKKFSESDDRLKKCARWLSNRFNDILLSGYKLLIGSNIQKFRKLKLTSDEEFILSNININPHLLLILDDCASQFKQFQNHDIFEQIFYQGRHAFITCLICCQDDIDLPSNLRKNVMMSIYCAPEVCTTNFDRASNGYSQKTKSIAREVCDVVFNEEYRKLMFIPSDPSGNQFYHLTAMKPEDLNFTFGSDVLNELCSQLQSNESSIDKNNPFYKDFIS